jgi:hypothetical protein
VDVVSKVLVHLARMVGDFQHSDSGHSEQFGFVKNEALVVSGHISAIVPCFPVKAIDQWATHEAPHIDHPRCLSESSLSLVGGIQKQLG